MLLHSLRTSRQDQQCIRPFFAEDPIDGCQHPTDLHSECLICDAEIEIGLTDPQLLEEDVTQIGIEVLSGVYELLLAQTVEQL